MKKVDVKANAFDYHPTFADVGRVATESKTKKLVLSHFYPAADRYDYKKGVRKEYKGPMVVGRDLMKIEI